VKWRCHRVKFTGYSDEPNGRNFGRHGHIKPGDELSLTHSEFSDIDDNPAFELIESSISARDLPFQELTKVEPDQLFYWHLQHEGFDHTHWWPEAQKDIKDQVGFTAAWWEIVRRQPRTRELMESSASGYESVLMLRGLHPWPSLNEEEKNWWREEISKFPPQHGFDPGCIYSVTAESIDFNKGAPPQAVLTEDPALRVAEDELSKSILQSAELVRTVEIGRLASEHHKAGRIIFALDPNIYDFDSAVEAFKVVFRQHHHPPTDPLQRVSTQLARIRKFESEELVRNRDLIVMNKELARLYREAVSSVIWPVNNF
jgi:hypothetical protein